MLVLLPFQEFPHVVPMCSFCLLKKKKPTNQQKTGACFYLCECISKTKV